MDAPKPYGDSYGGTLRARRCPADTIMEAPCGHTDVSCGHNYGGGSVLVGRLDFKSSMRGSGPVVGGFDSHTLPPEI